MVSDSGNGMQTRTWGPMLHSFLHIATLSYKVKPSADDKARYRAFFTSLGDVLPCAACRESYKQITGPRGQCRLTWAVFKNRESLARWYFEVHNAVSCRTGKGRCAESFERAMARYEVCRASTCKEHKCDTADRSARRRAVVLLMNDDQYRKLGFRGSVVDLARA